MAPKTPTASKTPSNETEPVARLQKRLETYRNTLTRSHLLEGSFNQLENHPFTAIRCLALGSPSESSASIYQLAYLLEIAEHFEVPPNAVSFYDPVFEAADEALFELLGFVVEETHEPQERTLYFLPHAPLDLTESLFTEKKPSLVLANDMVTHTERMSRQKLHDQYRQLSLLVHLVEEKETIKQGGRLGNGKENCKKEKGSDETKAGPVDPVEIGALTNNGDGAKNTSKMTGNGAGAPSDGFTTVRRKKRSRGVFVPPSIAYDYTGAYFGDMCVKRCVRAEGPWGNAFTDLALHVISEKEKAD